MDNFDAEDGGGLVDAFEKGNNIPSAVSQKGFALKNSSESEIGLHLRAASRKGSVPKDSSNSVCTGGQHPERALQLKTLWNLVRVVGQRPERVPRLKAPRGLT
jgi:hypothetical protein